MTFRQATANDIDAIAGLHTRSWQQTYRGMLSDEFLDTNLLENRLEVWQKRLTNPAPNQWIRVAEQDGQLGGFVCAFGADHPEFGSLVDNLHVYQDFKGKGIGKKLLQQAARWVQETYHVDYMYLWVLEGNLYARDFYERLGAINKEKALHIHPDGKESPALRYIWSDFSKLY